MNSDGKILPVEIFEFTVGSVGYVRWNEPNTWVGDRFKAAVVLWIHAEPLSWR